MLETQTDRPTTNNRGQAISRPLPDERLEKVWAWGRANSSLSYVYRPSTLDDLRRIFSLARQTGRTVGFRGGGNSYGDAAMNSENILVDLRRMNRILAWDPVDGIIRVEPGVTLAQLWQYVLEDGWWPAVVTGTMETTIGGCAAMNVHGKNAWQVGPIGDHIIAFDLLLPAGDLITCSRDENAELFHAAIGGFGMLGCFTSLTLRLKRVYSGYLLVEELASRNLAEMFQQFDEHLEQSDYIVGWIDATAGGKGLGRGQIHLANYLAPGVDPYPRQSLRLDYQHLPDTILGFVPRSIMWLLMRPFLNNLGVPLINSVKYCASLLGHGKKYHQTHTSFHFLLNYIPHWKKAYGPGGLLQYQSFLPKDSAQATFAALLRLGQKHRLPNYLSVLKRHRPDDFLMTHGLDGFSLAMDFRLASRNRPALQKLVFEMDEIVLAAGGRFYFAKDITLRPSVARAYLGEATVARFLALRQQYDPEGILATDLWRRLFES